MTQNTFLLYGANGYTGTLIARFAAQYQLQPILAGRTKDKIETLATALELPYKVLDINDTKELLAALRSVKLVVNAAGPFVFTADQMVKACLQTGTHYIDINGDIDVFEQIKSFDAAAKEAGIMLLPGAGFDVVPTDCLALFLKTLLPDANSLKLAFATLGGAISHGTAMSMLLKLGKGGAVRKEGKIVRLPLGQKSMTVDFGMKKIFVMSIPWGDVSTAYHTTAIPDIEAYTSIKPWIHRLLKLQYFFNPLLKNSLVRNYIAKKINSRPAGPTDAMREKAISLVWGMAKNANNQTVTARLRGPEGYTLTAIATLLIAQKVLDGNFTPGYQTPAGKYGADLVMEIPGVTRERVRQIGK